MKNASNIFKKFLEKKDKDNKLTYIILWKNWNKILGEPVSNMAKPLGVRKNKLIIGVEDSILMQELVFYQEDILNKINHFLGNQIFDKIIFKLLEEKAPLDKIFQNKEIKKDTRIQLPEKIGSLLDKIPNKSPVFKAYNKYLDAILQKKLNEEETGNE